MTKRKVVVVAVAVQVVIQEIVGVKWYHAISGGDDIKYVAVQVV